MIRTTTNGVLRSYRSNLMRSTNALNSARNTVLTQRNYNSFAEDPASAAQSFQLRRSYLRTESQYTTSQSMIRKYENAWNALDGIESMLDTSPEGSSWKAILEAANDPTAAGKNALGQQLGQLAEGIVETMNTRYGDSYIFAGADGLNVPFTWQENADGTRTLLYRGIDVSSAKDSPDPDVQKAFEQLEYLSGEKKYVDIGLGLQEEGGELIESSAFDSAINGINFLGYGVDDDGDPKNIASIIDKMADILSRCSEDGDWANTQDEEDYRRLMGKFETASAEFKESYIQLDARSSFLKTNHKLLEDTAYNLNEHFLEIDQVDLADAISAFSWAQYSYNAALKMGNSILSQSLMDYLN